MARARGGNARDGRGGDGVREMLRVVAPHFRPQRARFLSSLGLKCAGEYAFLIVPSVIRGILDASFDEARRDESAAASGCAILLLLYLVRALLAHGGGYLQRVAGENLAASLRVALFARLQTVAAAPEPDGVAVALAAMHQDVATLRDAVTVSFFHAALGSAYALGGVAICLSMSPRLVVVVAAFTLPALILTRLAKRPLASRGERVNTSWARVARATEDALRHAAVVAAYGGEARETAKVSLAMDRHSAEARRRARLEALVGGSAFYAQSLSLVGVVWFGTREARRGTLTAGTLVALVYYVVEISKSAEKVAHHASSAHAASGAAARVVALLRAPVETSTRMKNGLDVYASTSAPALEFEDITFAYAAAPATRPALLRASFDVRRGERLALVGPSGGGKSTALKIALRLLEPSEGSYRLGGLDALRASVEEVRGRLAWVPQEPVIFSGTVFENVAYGSWNLVDSQAAAEALRAAQAREFVAALSEGMHTVVGAGGVGISGGQAARIGVARALARRPLVLLLDEFSAALDADSESAISAAVRGACTESDGRTACVVCAHRLAPTLDMEGIAVLEAGVVVESGTPSKLLSLQTSRYRRLVDLQRGDDERRYGR